eukprot:1160805-Pelagomonas_calceolata.AAC.1
MCLTGPAGALPSPKEAKPLSMGPAAEGADLAGEAEGPVMQEAMRGGWSTWLACWWAHKEAYGQLHVYAAQALHFPCYKTETHHIYIGIGRPYTYARGHAWWLVGVAGRHAFRPTWGFITWITMLSSELPSLVWSKQGPYCGVLSGGWIVVTNMFLACTCVSMAAEQQHTFEAWVSMLKGRTHGKIQRESNKSAGS